jgi:hypothetical protein
MKNFPIIDADGHVTESLESLKKHLSNDFKNRPLFTTEAWDRSFGGTLGKRNEDPKVQMADMDLDGIDIQVVFPTHLSLNSEKETALASISRATTTTGLRSFVPLTRNVSREWRWLLYRTLTPQFGKCAVP